MINAQVTAIAKVNITRLLHVTNFRLAAQTGFVVLVVLQGPIGNLFNHSFNRIISNRYILLITNK